MNKHETALRRATSGQLLEIAAKAIQAMPADRISFNLAGELIGTPGRIARLWEGIFTPSITDIQNQQRFYREVLNRDITLSPVLCPNYYGDFNLALWVAGGLTISQLFEACDRMGFKVYTYVQHLDERVRDVATRPRDTYCILLRGRCEADIELKNKSAEWIATTDLDAITLKERLLLELWYFWKYRKHLDVRTITLCAGSRRTDDLLVPVVYWRDDRLNISWCRPGDTADDHCCREVVTSAP